MVRKIYITNSDKTKLQVLIDDLIKTNLDGKEYVKDLNAELERAIIVTDDDIPHNVITMHSKVSSDRSFGRRNGYACIPK